MGPPEESSFSPANTMQLPKSLYLPSIGKSLVAGLISELEAGCINMIEADQLKKVHTTFHHIMVDAVSANWEVLLVDLANCFNPQKISSIAFSSGLHGQLVLQQIVLARPFQIHQAVSIIKKLVRQAQQADTAQLIVITDISSLFFDTSLASEDSEFPIPQLELMRQCIGILQSLAVQGHMVLISNSSERVKSLPTTDTHQTINPASLKYSAKLHIKITHGDDYRRVELISHPYLPSNTSVERDMEQMIRRKRPAQQRSLNEFF